jgi:hypothetical protein
VVVFSLDLFRLLTSSVALRFWSRLSFRLRVKESFLLPECTLLALFWIIDTDKCSLWVAGTWIRSMTRITQNWIYLQFVHRDMFLATCYAYPPAVSYCYVIFFWVWLQTFVYKSVSQSHKRVVASNEKHSYNTDIHTSLTRLRGRIGNKKPWHSSSLPEENTVLINIAFIPVYWKERRSVVLHIILCANRTTREKRKTCFGCVGSKGWDPRGRHRG